MKKPFAKNIKFSSELLFLIVIFSLILCPKNSLAAEPFGGFILSVIDCDCSMNKMIFHTKAAGPMPVMYQPGVSWLFEFQKIEVGQWFLGNVMTSVPCIKRYGPFCVNLGSYPLITIVGTSGSPGDSVSGRSPVRPPATPPTPGTGPAGGSGGVGGQSGSGGTGQSQTTQPGNNPTDANGNATPASQGKTEAQVRQELEQNGVHIAPGLSPTLSPVSKLPNNAIAGMEDLSRDCGPGCNVMVTSGARQPGNATAPGNHGTGKPVFDLNKDPGVDRYITSNAASSYSSSAGTYYRMPNGDSYLDENWGNTGGTGAHWHVQINSNHM